MKTAHKTMMMMMMMLLLSSTLAQGKNCTGNGAGSYEIQTFTATPSKGNATGCKGAVQGVAYLYQTPANCPASSVCSADGKQPPSAANCCEEGTVLVTCSGCVGPVPDGFIASRFFSDANCTIPRTPNDDSSLQVLYSKPGACLNGFKITLSGQTFNLSTYLTPNCAGAVAVDASYPAKRCTLLPDQIFPGEKVYILASPPKSSSNSLSTGAIIGIAVGSAVAFFAAIGLIILLVQWKRSSAEGYTPLS